MQKLLYICNRIKGEGGEPTTAPTKTKLNMENVVVTKERWLMHTDETPSGRIEIPSDSWGDIDVYKDLATAEKEWAELSNARAKRGKITNVIADKDERPWFITKGYTFERDGVTFDIFTTFYMKYIL